MEKRSAVNIHPFLAIKTETAEMIRPTRVRWGILGLLLAFSVIGYIERVNISVVGALIMHEFDLTQVQLGWVFSAFLIGYTACQTPAGALADRFGPRLVLAVAGLGWALLTVLTALLPGLVFASLSGILAILIAVRSTLGICEAPMYPAAARAIANWMAPAEKGFASGMVLTGALFGSAVTAPMVSFLMVHLGWRNALVVTSIFALAAVLLWVLYATDHPHDHRAVNDAELSHIVANRNGHRKDPPIPKGWRILLGSGQAWKLSLAYGCQSYLTYLFIFWSYIYFVEIRKFSLLGGGLVAAIPFLVSTLTTPAAGALSDWLVTRIGRSWGRRTIPVVALPASAVLVFVGASVQDDILAVVMISCGVALALTPEGPFWATIMEIAAPVAGTAGGFLNTGGNLGGALSAALSPWVAKHIGWTGAIGVAGLFAVASSLLWVGVNAARPIVFVALAEATRHPESGS